MSKCGNCCYGVMTGPNRMFCSAQNCSCEEVFDCEDYDPIVKPQTNADRVRAMSDEELARWLTKTQRIGDVEVFRDGYYQLLLDWLKEEVETNDS